jgi:hypothetical protein
MAVLDLVASEHELRLAREQALYALEDYGNDAERRLSQKAEQTRSRAHRLIYRRAIDEVRKLRG